MKRREMLLLLGGGMIAAGALRAQQKAMPVIGYLGSATPGANALLLPAFHAGLSETGYVEGQNVAVEYRWAEGRFDRLPALAADLQLDKRRESGVDLALGVGLQDRELYPLRARCFLHVSHHALGARIFRVNE